MSFPESPRAPGASMLLAGVSLGLVTCIVTFKVCPTCQPLVEKCCRRSRPLW